VSGLVNTGGLQLNAFSFAPDRGIAVLSPSPSGAPALNWSTGPAPKPDSAVLQAVSSATERPLPVSEDAILLATEPPSKATNSIFLALPDLNRFLRERL
jgi:hypothetical protein